MKIIASPAWGADGFLAACDREDHIEIKVALRRGGMTGEEIDAELEVAPATLYNWRRSYDGMDTDAAKERKGLREQNARLKRLLADAELVKDALREVAKGKS